MAPKRRWEKPVATHVGPTKDGWDWSTRPKSFQEPTFNKFREFSERMEKEGWSNPYPSPNVDLNPAAERKIEQLQESLSQVRTEKDKAEATKRNNSAKGGKAPRA